MYCKNCGQSVDTTSVFCSHCGAKLDNRYAVHNDDDKSSFAFGLLGFFIPLAGFILFLVYEGKRPKRAKCAGKGALIGFVTKIVISIVCTILSIVFSFSLFGNLMKDMDLNIPVIGDILDEKISEKHLEDYVDLTFGELHISDNRYFSDTSLEVTIKNKADTRCTSYITIEAIDDSGTRIDTDMIYADRLNPGQSICLTAFEHVEKEKIEQFKNATFKVLEIDKFNL